MSTEYRQFLPAEKVEDPDELASMKSLVAANIAAMVSDDPDDDLVSAVKITIEPAEAFQSSCSGPMDGAWVCGSSDRDPDAWYMRHPFDRSEWSIGAGHQATDRPPVDLDPDEYAAHLEAKEARRGVR